MSLWGITDANISKPKYLDRGQIVKINVTDGGSEYGSAPTVTISAPDSGTTATATATISDGVVTDVVITNPGAGYTEEDEVTVSFSTGDAEAFAVFHGAKYANGNIYFVDNSEAQQAENRVKGLKSPGWWLYSTYTDTNSVVRHKAELLVAMSVTATDSGDASDDAVLVDRTITIGTAPVAASVTAPAAASFVVVATASPTASLTYQWQKSTTSGGSVYANLSNAGVYTGVTTATLAISDSTGLNGYKYRVIVSSSGATSVTTTGVALTVA